MEDISALSYPVAFAAGFVSFVSPCVLAVVPGYLSFISGVSFDELGARTQDVLGPTVAFVLGFSLMFTAYGASAGLIGYSLTHDQDTLNLVAGSLLIVMGVAMVALPAVRPDADRAAARHRPAAHHPGRRQPGGRGLRRRLDAVHRADPRQHPHLRRARPARPAIGATLLFTYSLGLGIPFLLSGLFVTRALATFRWIRDRWRLVNAGAAAVFIADRRARGHGPLRGHHPAPLGDGVRRAS